MNNFQRNKPKRQTLIEDSSIIAEITNENQYLVAEREKQASRNPTKMCKKRERSQQYLLQAHSMLKIKKSLAHFIFSWYKL